MTYAIQDIEGVGPAIADKLLELCGGPNGRRAVSEKTVQGWIEQARTMEARVTH